MRMLRPPQAGQSLEGVTTLETPGGRAARSFQTT